MSETKPGWIDMWMGRHEDKETQAEIFDLIERLLVEWDNK